jgi:hypothetical protein
VATIHINDNTYQQLARQAAEKKITVDKLVEPVLDEIASSSSAKESSPKISADRRLAAFNEWMDAVKQRSNRYPQGFVVDDRRESIYAGCGE